MIRPLEVNDHENAECLRIDDDDIDQANFGELDRHADKFCTKFGLPLPQIKEDSNESG